MNVRYETGAGVAVVTLDRPQARNALDRTTKEELRDALAEAAADSAARAVLLQATGPTFCAGQDLVEHAARIADASSIESIWQTVPDHYIPITLSLLTMPKPVIAAVNGMAAGAGAAMAFASDFRVLASDAGFAIAFSAIGLPCDTGTSVTLPRLVGWARATDLLMRPRTVRAEEALSIGLATAVVPPEELSAEAMKLAESLASGPTVAYAGIKAALLSSYGLTQAALDEALAFEGEMMKQAGGTRDHKEAVKSFLAKESPTFTGT